MEKIVIRLQKLGENSKKNCKRIDQKLRENLENYRLGKKIDRKSSKTEEVDQTWRKIWGEIVENHQKFDKHELNAENWSKFTTKCWKIELYNSEYISRAEFE